MKNSFISKYGAYLIAAVLFVTLSCIYCAPSLKGLIVNAGDTDNYQGMVHEITEFQKESGEDSFWTGSMFCGMPTYQIGGSKYASATWLKPLKSVLLAGHKAKNTPAILILYFVCFFILLRAFDVDRWVSIAGAIAITLSSYFILIIPAGHISKTSTIAVMAVTIGGFRLMFRGRYGLGFILTSIPCAVSFTNHPQMSYYIFMLIGTLWFAELYNHIKEKKLKDFGIATLLFAASVGIGLGSNGANIFANREYVTQTMRGGHSDLVRDNDDTNKTSGLDLDYATEWSYGIDESLSFIIPGVMGGASTIDVGQDSELYKSMVSKGVDRRSAAQFCQNVPLYWGKQRFTAGNVYMGAVVCFLFVLGLILVRGAYKWAIALSTLLSIALAWGHNFMPLTEFFFRYFPLYNKFRAVSSILIVAEITMPLLGFMAIREIMSGRIDRKKTVKGIYTAAGITAGICLIIAILGKSIFSFQGLSDASYAEYYHYPDFIMNGIVAERKSLLVSDALRSALFIILAAGVIWLCAKEKLKGWQLSLILGVLVLADMWPVDRRYFNEGNYISKKQHAGKFEMKPYEKQILSDKDPHFRVLNLTVSTFNDSRTSYYLKSLGGYSAAKLRRYQDLIDNHISKMDMNVISMLNAKYIITVDNEGNPTPMRNTQAMGNAWYVDTLLIVDNANQEDEALGTINLHTTAVLDRTFSEFVGNPINTKDSTASVRLTKYTPRYIDYESESSQDGTIVFSEIYYPYGWKAYIDDKFTPHFRADYTLRALNVPAGHHIIHFEFAPDSVEKGDTISIICICTMYLITLCLIIGQVVRSRRTSK